MGRGDPPRPGSRAACVRRRIRSGDAPRRRPRRSPVISRTRLSACLGLIILTAACGETPDAPPAADTDARPKVAVFGVDGATFDVIAPLVERGRLPHLAALMDRGSHVVLRSSSESSASPVLWTSIMTGTGMATHGITGFTKVEGERTLVFSSNDRQVPALWNLVDRRGGTSGVVGVWCTWPAEPVRGYVVSDRFAHTKYREIDTGAGDETARVAHPPGLADELAEHSLAPQAVEREALARFGEFTDAEWRALLMREPDEAARKDSFATLTIGYQAQESVARASLELLQRLPQPDLFVTFLELPDRVGHRFQHTWEATPDEAVRATPGDDWRARWHDMLPMAYVVVDEWIGRLVAELDDDTTIFVVSDHGMRLGEPPPGGHARLSRPGVHDLDGILIAAGPAIRAGATCEAGLLDVAPTVLAALGLPGSTQVEGRTLHELFEPAFVRAHPPGAPLDDARDAAVAVDHDADVDRELLEALSAFGYLGSEDG